ncbi:glycosyltransferase [Rhodococcus sp. MSC1_016]|jgi:glycosyltransferase involved in cell wall biosynthesis|uniref:glycosyltransferase n=1 Tax=Rhodococcus sp. MSC1_016 TaxID=2909266 RepID=UPI00202F53B6|nr:glycosyltransferase [Rhodococcus sp. MSC1_016]
MTRSVAILGTRGYPSYYGGFETLVRRLAPHLVSRGWDVTVYGRRGSTFDADPDRDPRVQVRTTLGVESKSASTLSYGLTSTVDTALRKPDVALVMNVANGFWLPALRMRGVPSLVNVDGIEWERAKWSKRAKQVFRQGAQLTAKYANGLVMDSLEIQRRWETEFNRSGDFIPYGGDAVDSLEVVDGLTPGEYVLMVARFVPENTVSEFIDAAEILSRSHDVVIVGSSGYGGELDRRVEELAGRSARIKWLGHVSDDTKLFSLWQHAGVYFHGHSVGGTNPALVQAMACGAPIVARDTVYNREVLRDAGLFVRPVPEDIAGVCLKLLGSSGERKALSLRALEEARTRYTWESVCERYGESLVNVLDASQPGLSELRRGRSC